MASAALTSFTGRLHRLFVRSAAIVLFLAGIIILGYELYKQHTQIVNRALSFSGITAPHLANVTANGSAELAQLLIKNYYAEADLLGIYVFRKNGELLVKTSHPQQAAELPPPSYRLSSSVETSYQYNLPYFEFSQPIRLNGELVGQIYLQYGLRTPIEQMLLFTVFGLILYAVSVFAVRLLSRKIQSGISTPLDAIIKAMEQVTTERNFSIRIPEQEANQEMKKLVTGFNSMLERIAENDSQLKAQKQEIAQHVYYDPLTGLANRRLLIQRVEREILRSKRSGQIGALLYMDLDHFKTINDSLGHVIGDSILIGVAERIRSSVREIDTPARLGGDEFVILLPNLSRHETKASNNALSVAEKVRLAISESHFIKNRSLHVTPSIGIALFDSDNCNFEKLIMQADLAMYRAKEEGRNRVQFFLEQMQETADHRQQIEEKLRRAIASNILFLSYQPQVDKNQKVVGAEALIRWPDKDLGLVNPGSFIPIAEMTELICALGRWVLIHACKQLAEWQAHGKKIPLSINISPREFQQKEFVEVVQEIILTTGVKAEYLVFEITEGLLLSNVPQVTEKMRRLASLGIRFSLDDFGTGYSSLQYLKQLPLSSLKIDQSFVRDITTDPNDAAIVATIIAMAHNLEINVVAEGVEQTGELDYLKKYGCDIYQGFYFYRPLPADQMEELIDRGSGSDVQETLIEPITTRTVYE